MRLAPLFVGSLVALALSSCGKYAPLDRPLPRSGSGSAGPPSQPAGAEVKTVDPRDLDNRTQSPPS